MSDENLDTPAPASLMERLAAKFPPVPSAAPTTAEYAETTETTESADDGLADLTWEGQTFKVPPAVRDAVMRTDDYTRKTTDLAEQRKALDVARGLVDTGQRVNAFNESIGEESRELAIIDAYVKQARQIDTSRMSMEQIFRHKMEMDQVIERRNAVKESIDQKRSKFDEEINTTLVKLRKDSREAAAKKIGEFGEETEKSIRLWAVGEGFTESDADRAMLHPLSAITMWKAMQYDKVKAGAGKATDAAKALKPGVAGERMPQETRNRLEFGKAMKAATTSGQKAAIIEERLATGLFAKGK